MAVHFTPPSHKVECADSLKRTSGTKSSDRSKTARGQRRKITIHDHKH